MSDFSLLAVPNIAGMRLGWYIQLIGILILFGFCLFFLIYSLQMYRRNTKLLHDSEALNLQSQDMLRQLSIHNIHKASGKEKLILFIAYLEKFVTNRPTNQSQDTYANITELLSAHGFNPKETEECAHVLYTNHRLSQHIVDKIESFIS